MNIYVRGTWQSAVILEQGTLSISQGRPLPKVRSR
jgi:hypothetical protein